MVAEGPDAMTAASAVGGHYLLSYLHDAATLVRVHGADGKRLSEVTLPGIGTASGFGGRWSSQETFFSYTSLTNPAEIHRYDVKTGQIELFKRPKTALQPGRVRDAPRVRHQQGRHALPDLHRREEGSEAGRHEPDAAVRLRRFRHPHHAGLRRHVGHLAEDGRRLRHRLHPRRRRIRLGLA